MAKKTKKVSKKNTKMESISLGDFIKKDGNVFLVASEGAIEEGEVSEFVRATTYLYRKFINEVHAISKEREIQFELKGILKI